MNTANEVIAFSLAGSRTMLHRFTQDLAPAEFLHRPAAKANCAAWLIGHLTLTDRRLLTRLGAALPELPAGFEKTFSREEGSPEANEFGDVSILLPLFDQHRDALIAAVRAVPPEQLNQPLEKPMPMFKTLGEMITFMSLHTMLHVGQITIIRRSLGRPPVV